MLASISQDLEEFMQSEVANGHFASREEVIAAGLTLLRDRQSAFIQRVREFIAESDATPGEDIVLHNAEELRAFCEDIKKRGRERLERKPTLS